MGEDNMAKKSSRGAARRKQNQPRPTQPPPRDPGPPDAPAKPPPSRRKWLKVVSWVFGAIVAACGALWKLYTEDYWPTDLQIEVVDEQPADARAFVIPFKVTNPSKWFRATNVRFLCAIGEIKLPMDSSLGESFMTPEPIQFIEPEEKINRPCDFRRFGIDAQQIVSAKLWISVVSERWPGKSWCRTTEEFTFIPPLWVPGTFADAAARRVEISDDTPRADHPLTMLRDCVP
jgi:hypothetical protein